VKKVDMMAGCQEGRSPSMLAAHNRNILLAFNTNKEKERKKKTID